jgi:hypothetical protein
MQFERLISVAFAYFMIVTAWQHKHGGECDRRTRAGARAASFQHARVAARSGGPQAQRSASAAARRKAPSRLIAHGGEGRG